ncbi:hypothetical protein D9611_014594 [Ephemerocybe angulata]|uniref:CHAT domain-containing protein n=1 Tax=Ephemerocybe angulata TaxID=980116 RepID=A0A8H5CBH2_9AGAR|nr:hypothetical protein D9611_014594 [Tulosesus angulatus]
MLIIYVSIVDLAVEFVLGLSELTSSFDLKELNVFAPPDSEEGQGFELVRTSSQRWEVPGFVELPKDEDVDFIINSGSGEVVALLHVDERDLTLHLDHELKHSQMMECRHAGLELRLSWSLAIAAPEGQSADDDILEELNEHGIAFASQFESTGALEDIAEAISAFQTAIRLAPEGHTELAGWLNNLGNAFLSRFERTGYVHDLGEALRTLGNAVDISPENDKDLPSRLSNLGNCFNRRFERDGHLEDVDKSIALHQRAVELTPEDDLEDRAAWLNNLGNAFTRRFEYLGDVHDIDEAISAQRRAIETTVEGHEELPCMLSNLGNSLWYRFEQTGGLADVVESISSLEHAIRITPEDHAELAPRLSNLANSFASRFRRNGILSDIAAAISATQKSVLLTPDDHPDLGARLSNLGNLFLARFDRTGETSDVTESIEAYRRTVDLTLEDHADMHIWLSNLGNALRTRFDKTRDLNDINEAVSVLRRAIKLTPVEHGYLPTYLSNLGISLMLRFEKTSTQEHADIEEAISTLQNSVQLISEDSSILPSILNSLGASYRLQFNCGGDIRSLEDSIATHQKAVQLAPTGHAELPSWMKNLGNALYKRFTSSRTHSPADLESCLCQISEAATCGFGSPHVRLDAAIRWAEILQLHKPLSIDIIDAFDTALSLVALTVGLEQTVERRYTRLRAISGLPQEAASAAFRLGRLDKAIEWLEQGRCLVWAQLNNLRTPVENLRTHNGDLADEVEEVARKLDMAGSTQRPTSTDMSLLEKITVEDQARGHLELSTKWDRLLETVRAIPGYETFLMPSPCSTLIRSLPEYGTVIVINVHKSRCDAIALSRSQDRPHHIPLPDFSLAKANQYRGDIRNELESWGLRVRRAEGSLDSDTEPSETRPIRPARLGRGGGSVVRDVLRNLWVEVVRPCIGSLGLAQSDDQSNREELPRIWWCPTGPLSFLPLHAAGIYGNVASESVLDHVVSSYIPTVSALSHRAQEAKSAHEVVSGLLLISQPNVPGASPIPGTTREVRVVRELAETNRARVESLDGTSVTVEACLELMPRLSSIHLACHASQSTSEPLQSRFLFHSGALDLATIMQRNLHNADLAFLSACQTSSGEEKLPDEAVHLAAGMLAAGYRRVVATMWSIGDRHAPDLAKDFYEYLWSHSDTQIPGGFDGERSAYALHYAVQRLRNQLNDNGDKSLLAWTPYVHFGK